MAEREQIIKEEECLPCVLDTGVGIMFQICRDALQEKKKIDCHALMKEYAEGRVSREEVIKRVKDAARESNEPDGLADLEEVERIMRGGKIDE